MKKRLTEKRLITLMIIAIIFVIIGCLNFNNMLCPVLTGAGIAIVFIADKVISYEQ